MEKSNKLWILALAFCFFFGCFGFHRFYVGRIGSGIVQLLTLGGFGIWAFVDFIVLLCGRFKDGDGLIISNEI